MRDSIFASVYLLLGRVNIYLPINLLIMKNRFSTLIIIALCATQLVNSQVTIHTIGDSTMEQKATDSISNPNGQRGWAQMLTQFVINGATINDRAKSGTSSKTFYEAKDAYGNFRFWPTVKPQIKTGDYVIIQFGHNDEKDGGWQSSQNGAVYSGIGTNPWEEYTKFLTKYINEVRALGAIPILFTPIVRNSFSGATMTPYACHNIGADSIGRPIDYPAAARKVATDLNCPMIDHTLLTKAVCEQYGQTQTTKLIYNVGDGTHIGIYGATLYARIAVQELVRQGILTNYLNANPDLMVSATSLNFGKCYVNASSITQVSVSGVDLTPANGNVTVTAPTGFYLSSSQNGTYSSSLVLPYSLGNLVLTTFYLKYNPATEGNFSGNVVLTNGTSTKSIAVSGQCISLAGGQKAKAYWELIANSDAVSEGPITVIPETYSNMVLQNYAAPSSTTTWTGGLIANGTKTQRNVINGTAWPAGEIDIVNNRYIQFGVTALKGTIFDIDSIGLYAGGAGGSGMRFKIYISKDSLFSNPDVTTMITDRGTIANAGNTMYPIGYNKLTELTAGESLYLRVFPWYNGAASGKTICLYSLLIKGVVTVSGESAVKRVDESNVKVKCIPSITSGSTVLNYSLSNNSDVVLDIKTIDGKSVRKVNITNQAEGEHQYYFDLNGLATGVYFCSVQTQLGSALTRIIKR